MVNRGAYKWSRTGSSFCTLRLARIRSNRDGAHRRDGCSRSWLIRAHFEKFDAQTDFENKRTNTQTETETHVRSNFLVRSIRLFILSCFSFCENNDRNDLRVALIGFGVDFFLFSFLSSYFFFNWIVMRCWFNKLFGSFTLKRSAKVTMVVAVFGMRRSRLSNWKEKKTKTKCVTVHVCSTIGVCCDGDGDADAGERKGEKWNGKKRKGKKRKGKKAEMQEFTLGKCSLEWFGKRFFQFGGRTPFSKTIDAEPWWKECTGDLALYGDRRWNVSKVSGYTLFSLADVLGVARINPKIKWETGIERHECGGTTFAWNVKRWMDEDQEMPGQSNEKSRMEREKGKSRWRRQSKIRREK